MHLLQRYIATLIILFTASCEIINPEEDTASFVEINHTTVSSNYTTQGTASSNVSDVWVYMDGNYLGTFSLPARIPILAEGEHKLSIGAGVLFNGIASTRGPYPFYKFHDTNVVLRRGEITVVDTVPVAYFPALAYKWYEDFEGSGISLDTVPGSQTVPVVDTLEAFEGKGCLKMNVNSSETAVRILTNDPYVLPAGNDIFLEMDYKCDHEFEMGVVSTFNTGEQNTLVIKINPSETWNKIYIKLNQVIAVNGNASGHKLYFSMNLASGATSGTVFMDNLKLIHN